ncbi:hypothetical protein [Clostridium sp. 3-3]|uniref:hypothetical protein n=1 Tax=Clostridium sp. 3-3 TaxID=2070757 RepID=UPI0011AF8C44|nr:hypothetical protein [Clostridium sp. 3-3]
MATVGRTKEEIIRESMNSPEVIDTSVEFKIPRSAQQFDPLRHKYKCSCCGMGYTTQNGNFQKSNDVLFQANDGYLPWCKNCTDSYMVQSTALFSDNEELAMKDFCHRAGWNYDLSALIASRETYSGHRNRSRISHYAAKKNLNCEGRKTYIDSIKFEFENRNDDVIDSFEDAKESKRVKLKTVKFFGTGFTDDDYIFLEDEYLDWTTRHECNTKAQEEVFKQICFAQLDILKAKRGNLSTKDLTKTLQDLLATANLQPKQTKDNTLAEQNTFGTLIRKWENEKPIPEPDEEWKDVDGIVKYVTVYFLGHLCKMMGIKNSYSHLYELEMSKYKVDKPEYEDDDEALFDAVFGGDLDDSDQ